MRILALITDAFGGHGGIALYNRDVLTALCQHREIEEIIAVPRRISAPLEDLPKGLTYDCQGAANRFFYFFSIFRALVKFKKFDFILCAHVNLMPLAWLLSKILKIPVVIEIYGIDAWDPPSRKGTSRFLGGAKYIISISEFTLDKFLTWAPVEHSTSFILPNAIHLENYGIGERPQNLTERYALKDKVVLMTFGRLVSKERAKGFDDVLELLPALSAEIPELVYIIAGDGDYREDLERKAVALQVQNRVFFTGMVKEEEKADLYRLADVYVMPSRGEGFGFVFLEAMACGIPVIASVSDGSREAVRNGEIGIVVDPDNPQEIKKAIFDALQQPHIIPKGLEYFSFENFTSRLHNIVNHVQAEKLMKLKVNQK